MKEKESPKNLVSLFFTQVSDFLAEEWVKFQQDLQKAYREDLDALGKEIESQNLIHPPSAARASFKVFNKTRREAQQRLLSLKGRSHIRDHTEDN